MTQTQFDILNPNLNLYQKYFVEASAGCGKTFSIENAYIRFLLSPAHSWMPKDILVLTFTKEATKELRLRIRLGIEGALYQLEHPNHASLPYIEEILNQGEEKIEQAARALSNALANFDQAQIFTLHSFCYRMLKEHLFDANLNLDEDFEDKGPSLKLVEESVRDFLNFKLNKTLFSPSQIQILFKYYRSDFKAFLNACIQEVSKEQKTLALLTYEEGASKVSELAQALTNNLRFTKITISSDLEQLAVLYKGAHSRSGEIKPAIKKAIIEFSQLFEKDLVQDLNSIIKDAQILFDHFKEENKKKRAKVEPKLNHTNLLEVLFAQFEPIISQLANPSYIFSNLVSYMQVSYEKKLREKKSLTPNNLLLELSRLVKKEEVARKIAFTFEAVIVDEFQDTDPIQWDILSSVFLKFRDNSFPFYLVGDPKQSIYAFRRADIYTYLKAAKELGEEHRMVLGTNYRSQPHLISALNDLFQKFTPHWIDLPKWNQTLPYYPVNSSPHVQVKDYEDDRKSIHFFLSEESKKREGVPSKELEEEKLFPFIINEILRLHNTQNIPLSSFAILVRDRFQGARLKKALKKYQIPFKSTRPEPLKGSENAAHFLSFYEAVLNPKSMRSIQNLELNPIFTLPIDDNEKERSLYQVMAHLASLKKTLFHEGFLPFYNRLMQEPFVNQKPFGELILSYHDGLNLYLEFDQLKDLLVQEEINGKRPEDFKILLEQFASKDPSYDSLVMQRQPIEKDAVQILSLHLSKGLEFEVVFALGLVNRTLHKENLIPMEQGSETLLVPKYYSLKDTESYHKEIASEKLRQLYVALTRAKQRLYIPLVNTAFVDETKSSPIEIFLERIGVTYDLFLKFVSSHPNMSLTEICNPIMIQTYAQEDEVELIPPTALSIDITKHALHSFSSLMRKIEHKRLDLVAPHNFDVEDKSIHNLPAGTETGTLYHLLMEKLNFRNPGSLDPFIENSPYENWKEVLDQNIQKVFNLPIEVQGETFSLSDLEPQYILKEVEFLYPLIESIPFEEFTQKGDQLQGVIDLVFRYRDKYYILDYKTNWLGPNEEAYDSLEEVIKINHYDLQASIYREALKKYLEVFDIDDFEAHFGGVIYYFIRGLRTYCFPN